MQLTFSGGLTARLPLILLPLTMSLAATMALTGCLTGGESDATSTGVSPKPDGVLTLFDGKTLKGWAETDFAGKGEIRVEDGKLILGSGFMTGVTYTNDVFPRIDYEISLDAMRVDGTDFFCGLTFPVGERSCSFVVGGWGGGVVGLSSIDGEDAANNNTTKYMNFESGRWYAIRVRVTDDRISAWIDEEQVVDQEITNREVSIRIEMEPCVPLGVATYSTTGALRHVTMKKIGS